MKGTQLSFDFMKEKGDSKPMLKNNGVGRSGTTPFKQKDLYRLINTQMTKSHAVFKKYGHQEWFAKELYYIDCSSGDLDPEQRTSPEIFLQTLNKHWNLPTRLYLIERHKKRFGQLKKNYQSYGKYFVAGNKNIDVFLKNEDMEETLFSIEPHRYRYGLLYFDPNGGTKDDYATLNPFLTSNPRIDVILNINASVLLKCRGVKKAKGFEKYTNFYLSTVINWMSRKNIWIRDNIQIDNIKNKSKFEYVMVFGTNMPQYQMTSVDNFIPIDSLQGQQILYKYNYTKKEKSQMEKEILLNDGKDAN